MRRGGKRLLMSVSSRNERRRSISLPQSGSEVWGGKTPSGELARSYHNRRENRRSLQSSGGGRWTSETFPRPEAEWDPKGGGRGGRIPPGTQKIP